MKNVSRICLLLSMLAITHKAIATPEYEITGSLITGISGLKVNGLKYHVTFDDIAPSTQMADARNVVLTPNTVDFFNYELFDFITSHIPRQGITFRGIPDGWSDASRPHFYISSPFQGKEYANSHHQFVDIVQVHLSSILKPFDMIGMSGNHVHKGVMAMGIHKDDVGVIAESSDDYIKEKIGTWATYQLQPKKVVSTEEDKKAESIKFLNKAIIANDITKVKTILKDSKIDLNAKDDDGFTALTVASKEGHIKIVEMLLNAKADINVKTLENNTALMVATANRHIDIVRLLLTAKSDVNAISTRGATALLLASGLGNIELVKLLLNAKAEVNIITMPNVPTALIMASSEGHLSIVKLLLTTQADVNATMKPRGDTALTAASVKGYSEVVQALINAKADVNAVLSKDNVNATALLQASGNGYLTIVRQLLLAGANVNWKSNRGYTALMMASDLGDTSIVQALLTAKADVNSKDGKGRTALWYATQKRHNNTIQLLKDAGGQ